MIVELVDVTSFTSQEEFEVKFERWARCSHGGRMFSHRWHWGITSSPEHCGWRYLGNVAFHLAS